MSCKGICVRYKAAANHYSNGHKRCQVCELFIQWTGYCVLAVVVDQEQDQEI
jgi:hypothetical protein